MSVLGRGIAALLLIIPLLACAQSVPEQYKEGTNYELITPPQPTENSDTVEVREVFWYACPHCSLLEPALLAWLKHKPANVTFIRMPAVLNPSWELLSRAYYAAEDLGVLDKIHEPLFHAIHEEHKPMNTDKEVISFFTAHGVKEDDIRNTMTSFSVETKLRRSKQMVERYGLTGVPAIIVNGKYRTNVSMAGSNDAVFKVVDFLVKKESAAAHGK